MIMRTYICEIRTEQNNIYIKRDDLFPFSFGGNKARKAVNFFKEIDNGDFDTVVTYGSSSSNHCRVISNMATVRNIPCYIISPYLWMRSAEQLMKSWLNLESVVESRTLSPVVVMAISEHRPMLTAITRYVHTKKRTNSTSITSSSHQGQALHRRVLCAVRLCMETREKSWVSALPERIQEVGRWCLTA